MKGQAECSACGGEGEYQNHHNGDWEHCICVEKEKKGYQVCTSCRNNYLSGCRRKECVYGFVAGEGPEGCL